MRETKKQALYRRLAMLLVRLPRGYETVLRIVRQRSGSPEEYQLAQLALAAAFRDLHDETKPLRALARETRRRERARERDRMKRAEAAWRQRSDYPSAAGLLEEWKKLGD